VNDLVFRMRSDATRLSGDSPCVLAHVLSDAFTWGIGFTQAIESRWPSAARAADARLRSTTPRPLLGDVVWSELATNIWGAHMIAERSASAFGASLDLDMLSGCLTTVAERALKLGATVHAPPLGTGLCGAPWVEVQRRIQEHLVQRGVAVVIHCLGNTLPQ
jgi:hypothetical protein